MTAREWDRLKAFYAIEPFGEYAENLRNAHIVTMLANIHRDTKKHPEPFALRDFLLFAEPEPEPTPEQMAAKVDAIFAPFAGGE